MPKLWTDTLDEHRRQVHEAIIDATAGLVDEHGLLALNMSQIAHAAGIGRKTLYRYFPDVPSIIDAWHASQVNGHLDELRTVRDRASDPNRALEAVFTAHAAMTYEHHGSPTLAADHGGASAALAQKAMHNLIVDTIAEAIEEGHVRADVPAGELAAYVMSALTAAAALPSKAAVARLVALTLDALQPRLVN